MLLNIYHHGIKGNYICGHESILFRRGIKGTNSDGFFSTPNVEESSIVMCWIKPEFGVLMSILFSFFLWTCFCQPFSHTFSISSSIVTEILKKNWIFSQVFSLYSTKMPCMNQWQHRVVSIYSFLPSKARSHPNHVGCFPRKYMLPIEKMLRGFCCTRWN